MQWDMKLLWGALATAAMALVGGIVVSGPGKAAGLGCHIALSAGMTSTTMQSSAQINGTTMLDVDSLGASGNALGGGVGCDFVVDKILLGAFADYAWHNASFKAQALGTSLNMDLDRQITIGGRTGVLMGDTLIYILAGWTKLSTTGLAGPVAADFGDFTGITLGGGLETALGKHVKLGVEYRHSAFDAATGALMVPGGLPMGWAASATVKPTVDAAFVRLTYSLDFFGSTASSAK